jgi:hypothetical protein
MTRQLVERLKKRADMVTPWATCCGEAAAEIERLRALRGDEAVAENVRVVSEFAKLRAEIERLTAAIAYVRMRSAHACEVLNEFDNTRAALERKP